MTNPPTFTDATASRGPTSFVTARRSLPSGDPAAFLRAMEGSSRGFWARGPRWVAHAGKLGEVRAAPGPGRFVDVSSSAGFWADRADREDALRFYGGFAFRDDHEARDEWVDFPVGLFHLPLVELDGEGDGPARLRVRVEVGDDANGALLRAEEQADRILESMTGAGASEAAEGIGATLREGERHVWMAAVEDTLHAIRAGRFSKAVLARTLDVELAAAVSPVDMVLALWNQHPGAHAFLFEPRPGALLLGAAPEVLVTLRDGAISATAVAGSVRRGETPEADRTLAGELLESAKDREEHRVVVEDMVRRLSSLAGPVSVQDEPHILTLARIQHLETEIEAPAPPARTALELAEALHPTPAVCGVPRDAALAFLQEAEPFHRGWYAGPVGWFDTEGEGHFVPALRTAVGDGRRWRLFAGAGIVEGSKPALEWEETGIKFLPVLRALAASGADLPGIEP